MSSGLERILCSLSGGCDAPQSGQVVAGPDVASAMQTLDARPAQAAAQTFTGAAFQDHWLNVAATEWASQREIQFSARGYGIHFLRDGSAPDILLTAKVRGSEIIQFSPGGSIVGPFDGFSLRLRSRQRSITRHMAHLVVETDPAARFVESPALRPRFSPVPLLGGERLLGQAGKAYVPIVVNPDATQIFRPAGFERIFVEVRAAGLPGDVFGAAEVWDVYQVSYEPTSGAIEYTALPDDRLTLDGSRNGGTAYGFTLETPPAMLDADPTGARTGMVVSWRAATGTCTAANVYVSGIK